MFLQNFLVFLLFGEEDSFENMMNTVEASWLNTVRDNQIRRNYGRAHKNIYLLILLRLLSDKTIQGYEYWYRQLIQYTLLQCKNSLHPSRKNKKTFSNTCQSLNDWCTSNLSTERYPSFTSLQDAFAILFSPYANVKEWRRLGSQDDIDKKITLLQVMRGVLPNHPF